MDPTIWQNSDNSQHSVPNASANEARPGTTHPMGPPVHGFESWSGGNYPLGLQDQLHWQQREPLPLPVPDPQLSTVTGATAGYFGPYGVTPSGFHQLPVAPSSDHGQTLGHPDHLAFPYGHPVHQHGYPSSTLPDSIDFGVQTGQACGTIISQVGGYPSNGMHYAPPNVGFDPHLAFQSASFAQPPHLDPSRRLSPHSDHISDSFLHSGAHGANGPYGHSTRHNDASAPLVGTVNFETCPSSMPVITPTRPVHQSPQPGPLGTVSAYTSRGGSPALPAHADTGLMSTVQHTGSASSGAINAMHSRTSSASVPGTEGHQESSTSCANANLGQLYSAADASSSLIQNPIPRSTIDPASLLQVPDPTLPAPRADINVDASTGPRRRKRTVTRERANKQKQRVVGTTTPSFSQFSLQNKEETRGGSNVGEPGTVSLQPPPPDVSSIDKTKLLSPSRPTADGAASTAPRNSNPLAEDGSRVRRSSAIYYKTARKVSAATTLVRPALGDDQQNAEIVPASAKLTKRIRAKRRTVAVRGIQSVGSDVLTDTHDISIATQPEQETLSIDVPAASISRSVSRASHRGGSGWISPVFSTFSDRLRRDAAAQVKELVTDWRGSDRQRTCSAPLLSVPADRHRARCASSQGSRHKDESTQDLLTPTDVTMTVPVSSADIPTINYDFDMTPIDTGIPDGAFGDSALGADFAMLFDPTFSLQDLGTAPSPRC